MPAGGSKHQRAGRHRNERQAQPREPAGERCGEEHERGAGQAGVEARQLRARYAAQRPGQVGPVDPEQQAGGDRESSGDRYQHPPRELRETDPAPEPDQHVLGVPHDRQRGSHVGSGGEPDQIRREPDLERRERGDQDRGEHQAHGVVYEQRG